MRTQQIRRRRGSGTIAGTTAFYCFSDADRLQERWRVRSGWTRLLAWSRHAPVSTHGRVTRLTEISAER
jgi:hypothetical protein